jgi:hypothetical protein
MIKESATIRRHALSKSFKLLQGYRSWYFHQRVWYSYWVDLVIPLVAVTKLQYSISTRGVLYK